MLPLGYTVPQCDVSFESFPENIVATRGEIFSLKFTKYRLAAVLRLDGLRELKRFKRSPDTLAAISKGEEGGQEGEGKRREGRGR